MAPLFLAFLKHCLEKNQLKLIIFNILFALFISSNLSGQEINNGDGEWVGYMSQENGGLKSRYNIRLELKTKGSNIEGYCFVQENNLNSKMEITGYWKSKSRFQIMDLNLMNHKEPDNIDWCYKIYELELKKLKGEYIIEGNWSGKTKEEKCIPGKVYLYRPKPKA
ncbi:MAG TPA: hypothetical protein VK590_02710 [Saprospiraceae bacterium]|nr:hypothetical protein [Saprospiraceae bacterium]